MSEKFIASCQYNDYRGTVALDHGTTIVGMNDLLREMAQKANLPAELTPIGFSYSGPQVGNDLRPTPRLHLTLAAVRGDEVGWGLDQWKEYGRIHGTIPAYRYRFEMDIVELLTYMKRLSINILPRDLDGDLVEMIEQ